MAYQDEVWFSRLAQPLVEKEAVKADPDPKAIACYGVLLAGTDHETNPGHETGTGRMRLCFVDGRPVSAVTCEFLGWLAQEMARAGKKALLLIWDNASWHLSKIVKSWLRAHNRLALWPGGCRLVVCFLPSKRPWPNAIEPQWVHGKRAVAEPVRPLTATELMERLCAYYRCEHEPHLVQPIAQRPC